MTAIGKVNFVICAYATPTVPITAIALTVPVIAWAITPVSNARRRYAKTNVLAMVTAWNTACVRADEDGKAKIAAKQSAHPKINLPIVPAMVRASSTYILSPGMGRRQ